jgi:hypothetical protein
MFGNLHAATYLRPTPEVHKYCFHPELADMLLCHCGRWRCRLNDKALARNFCQCYIGFPIDQQPEIWLVQLWPSASHKLMWDHMDTLITEHPQVGLAAVVRGLECCWFFVHQPKDQ